MVVNLCNFLAYGTTSQVARRHGAGHEREAGEVAAQALWLALAIGVGLALALVVASDPLAQAMNGGGGDEADAAARYLRIAAIGLPAALIALSGQGYLRGTGDLRSPLVILIAANLVNVVLEIWFVYGLDWGLNGSAAGTVLAQLGMGIAFAWLLLRAARPLAVAKPGAAATAAQHRRAPTGANRRAARLLHARDGCGRAVRRGLAGGEPDRVSAVRVPCADPRRGRDRRPGDDRPIARGR